MQDTFKICKSLHSMCLKLSEMLRKYEWGSAGEQTPQAVPEVRSVS